MIALPAPGLPTCPIFYGVCMREHTCEAGLPHITGNVVSKLQISGDRGAVPAPGGGGGDGGGGAWKINNELKMLNNIKHFEMWPELLDSGFVDLRI